MSPLDELIRQRIRQHGPMDLGEYMGLCLSHPVHGYYMTRDPLGTDGDFTTAPEVSQMFGEMIGAWLADLWIKMGSPAAFILLECGPGRGTLMADALRATKNVPGFHAAAKLHLMEISPVLKEAQKRALAVYDPVWIDDVAQLPARLPVLLVANEFLDALPVRQLRREKGGWLERIVSIGPENTLIAGEVEADPALVEELPAAIRHGGEDGIFETSRVLNQFIRSVDILLKTQGGGALFLDYGHAHTAWGETVQAVRAHKFAGIFDTPGLCDLTAHVDFENIARLAGEDEVAVHGPVTQGAFLKNLGIEVRAARLMAGANPAQADSLRAGLARLIDTEQMGNLFKVIALCNDPSITPAGFHEGL